MGLPIDNVTMAESADSSLEANTDRSPTSQLSGSTLKLTSELTLSVSTTMTTTQTSYMLLGKSISSSKSKNELLPGGSREIKPAHKIKSVVSISF